jgi:predicted MPP superfamily phosphohydrolase
MMPNTPEPRRAFLTRMKVLMAPVLLGGGSYGYASLLERHRLSIERHEVSLALGPRAPRKLRAVSLTDFHFDPLHEEEYIAECVRRTNELRPDLVFLTGDYITRSSRRIDDFAALLGGLRPKCGVFACLGNHDHWDSPSRVSAALRREHIDVLQNQHTRVSCNGGEVVLTGLQSVWGGRPDWSAARRGMKRGERVLALVHEPDIADKLASDPRIAMQFSGHTHGGQVRVPGIGALRLPSWGKVYQAGFYDVGNLKLHVNRGIGTVTYHVRFLCPPEIACFDITNLDAV